MQKHTLHEYSVRGHAFTILETVHEVGGKIVQVFAIHATALAHDRLTGVSLSSLLAEIDAQLPTWIERTRGQGHSVMGYDPRAPITRLPG